MIRKTKKRKCRPRKAWVSFFLVLGAFNCASCKPDSSSAKEKKTKQTLPQGQEPSKKATKIEYVLVPRKGIVDMVENGRRLNRKLYLCDSSKDILKTLGPPDEVAERNKSLGYDELYYDVYCYGKSSLTCALEVTVNKKTDTVIKIEVRSTYNENEYILSKNEVFYSWVLNVNKNEKLHTLKSGDTELDLAETIGKDKDADLIDMHEYPGLRLKIGAYQYIQARDNQGLTRKTKRLDPVILHAQQGSVITRYYCPR